MSLFKKSLNRKRLSIFVPTKDRAKYFNRLMESLVPQLTEECELVVSMNPPNDKYKVPPQAVVHRNRFDIGGRTNFLLGPVLCTGDYIWMLGDDEQIRAGGIQEILESLEGNPGILAMTDGRKDLGVPLGSKWPSYAAMIQAAVDNGAPYMPIMLTLASSTVSRRENFDLGFALLKTDTLYGQYYGMVKGNLWQPAHVVKRGTFISGHSTEASIYREPQVNQDVHHTSYPGVIHEIAHWLNNEGKLNIPVHLAWQPYKGFDL